MSEPLVTVSIPSYNHGTWIAEAIESVLDQTYPNVELVIVDDGSTDDSLAIAQRYAEAHPKRIRVLTHPGGANRGISATANLGIQEARGVYWAGLPSDDIYCPDKIERQVAVLEADRTLVFAYGYTRLVDGDGTPLGHSLLGGDLNGFPRPLERLLRGNTVPGMSALVRRAALLRLVPGLHREGLVYSDWDLWIRLVALGSVAFLPRVLGFSRMHESNTSFEDDQLLTDRRVLDVLRTIAAEMDSIGGGFSHPRARTALRLELALRYRADGALGLAQEQVRAALADDPKVTEDAGWLRAWLRDHTNRGARPDDGALWLLSCVPSALGEPLTPWFAALRSEQEARAAVHRGDWRAGWRHAVRSIRLRPWILVEPAFLRLLARLALTRRR